MIIGVGTDLCDIRRIELSLKRFGQRFIDRIYGNIEQKKANSRFNSAASYALSFATKEACSKALGTGISDGVFWRDIVVTNFPSGKPYLKLTGGAKKKLDALVPKGMTGKINISQTDEYPLAHAIVIISAETTKHVKDDP
ncbi:MAG: holo-ACP synthase [Pseudomonadota bacterium]|nr:holo-ACP synthase [Pseudomonadota bacterium]